MEAHSHRAGVGSALRQSTGIAIIAGVFLMAEAAILADELGEWAAAWLLTARSRQGR
jgi:hypothetical protein